MIIYNVTVNINQEVHQDWLQWMKETHIPQVMSTGCFVDSRMMRLSDPQPEEGVTYAIQYRAENMEKYSEYSENYAPALQEDHSKRYQNQFVAFRTILEQEQEF
jgi:hypothetical protein